MTNDQTPAIMYRSSASVAQLVEQLIRNQQVAGPSPATSSRCESLKSLERVGIWGFSPVCEAAADPLGASVGQARVSALEPAPFCPCCMPQRLHAGSNRVCARFDQRDPSDEGSLFACVFRVSSGGVRRSAVSFAHMRLAAASGCPAGRICAYCADASGSLKKPALKASGKRNVFSPAAKRTRIYFPALSNHVTVPLPKILCTTVSRAWTSGTATDFSFCGGSQYPIRRCPRPDVCQCRYRTSWNPHSV